MSDHATFRLGISGAVPEPEVLEEHKASSSDIHLTVRRIAERALADGHAIVYGSHPTFTPIIEDVALQQGLGPDQRRRVKMFVAKRYFTPEEWQVYRDRHARYSEVEPIGDFNTAADQALRELRDRMVGEMDAMVCIGGKLHRDNKGTKPGVEEEYERAIRRDPPIPIYLLGGPGGCTRQLYDRHDPPKTSNGLNEDENRRLGESAQAWDAVELVFKGLSNLRVHANGG
jgi:SLOG cluster2